MHIVYIVSGLDRMVSLEWTLEALLKQGNTLYVVIVEPLSSNFSDFLTRKGIRHETYPQAPKSQWPSLIWRTAQRLRQERADVVHCHFLLAGIIGLPAAFLARIKRRIYTRHHGAEHHLGHRQGVYLDKALNALATRIVAISPVVNRILTKWEGVSPAKIEHIPHGFDFTAFEEVDPVRSAAIRQKYGIRPEAYPVVGVVSRYDKPKGIQHIIAAFKQLRQQFPQAHLVLANARGSYKKELQALLRETLGGDYTEIEYEYDSVALYKVFDVFVHVPESAEYESFGLVYIEALAAGIPAVFTLSGIASEFIENEKNALVVPYSDAEAIAQALIRLTTDRDLAARLATQGHADVLARFQFRDYFHQLQHLYQQAG